VKVQIFTRDGAFVRKFGSHILQNPRGVTVDRLGNVIVVECKVCLNDKQPKHFLDSITSCTTSDSACCYLLKVKG